MPATPTAFGVTGDGGSTQSFTYTGITVQTGDTLLIFCFVLSNAGIFGGNLTLNWDSGGTPQAMTQIDNNASGASPKVFLFGLVNPTPGNKSLSVSWVASGLNSTHTENAISFTGTVTTSVAAAALTDGGAGGTGTALTTPTVTGNVNDYYVSGYAGASNLSSVSDNQLMLDNNVTHAGANYKQSAASVSMSAVQASSVAWATIGAEIVGAAGGGSNTPFNPWPSLAPMLAQRRSTGWTPKLVDWHRRQRPGRSRLWTPDRRIALPQGFKKAA